MKAIDAVENLRKLADLLEKHGDAEIRMANATVWFEKKEPFLEIAREMPRPLKKSYGDGPYSDFDLEYGVLAESGHIRLRLPRTTWCRVVEPAKPAVYDCDPILSADEEAQLEGAK